MVLTFQEELTRRSVAFRSTLLRMANPSDSAFQTVTSQLGPMTSDKPLKLTLKGNIGEGNYVPVTLLFFYESALGEGLLKRTAKMEWEGHFESGSIAPGDGFVLLDLKEFGSGRYDLLSVEATGRQGDSELCLLLGSNKPLLSFAIENDRDGKPDEIQMFRFFDSVS